MLDYLYVMITDYTGLYYAYFSFQDEIAFENYFILKYSISSASISFTIILTNKKLYAIDRYRGMSTTFHGSNT